MKTIVINAFGGPGVGKTTSALEITCALKKNHINVEFVGEYTKELIFDERWDMMDDTMYHQRMILAEQKKRIDRMIGKVQVVVNDSPLLLSIIYASDANKEFTQDILRTFASYNNINYVIKRNPEFAFIQAGRKQDYEGSLKKDKEIMNFLNQYSIDYTLLEYSELPDLIEAILERIS